MDRQALDQILLNQNITFLPWVGNKYEEGFHGRRLLVLGESHYDTWDGITHVLESDFTRECIQDTCARAGGAPFWKNVEQALLNESRTNGWAPNGGQPLWGRLACYNFVQSPISGGARLPPSLKQFQESQKPFKALLEQLRPDRVLVCGKRLWVGMEDVPRGEDYLHRDVQAYRLTDGTKVWCLATVHPSSGRYSWSRLHAVIMAFLNEPSDAVTLLKKS